MDRRHSMENAKPWNSSTKNDICAPLLHTVIAKIQEYPTLIPNGLKWFGLCSFLLENLDLTKISLSVQEDVIQTNPKESAEIPVI